jgi:hypothetical protein
MEISLALGSFIVVLGACTLAARHRPSLRPVPIELAKTCGEPGFLRRLAS